MARQQLDDDLARKQSSQAAVAAARAQELSADAAITAARSQVIEAESALDATQVSQAFTGAGHLQQIIQAEINEFLKHYRSSDAQSVEAVVRMAYNPNLQRSWLGSIIRSSAISPCCRSSSPALR